jgi:peptidoglycan/xylan/chitin deacetylase (PgdA/CDA1 family)
MRWMVVVWLGMVLVGSAGRAQEMAITFDDLPAHGTLPKGETRLGIADSVLKTLKAERMPPTYGFINGQGVDGIAGEKAVLQAWRVAGQPLGNHTWSHPDLDTLTAAQFEENIARNEPMLTRLMGEPDGGPDSNPDGGNDWHWFRYPYLHEGDTLAKRQAVRAWLGGHGYRVAEVNMDFGDYLWNDPYARCVARHDEAAIGRLHDSYLATAGQFVGVFRDLSQRVYGRDVKYVLLMHLGAFDAKMLPELLALYRAKGFTFISLAEAEADPAYKDDPDVADAGGGTELEMMMEAKGMKIPAANKPEKELARMCR